MAGKGAVEGCCAGCSKWLLIIFNIIFILIGLALIAAGAYAHITMKDYLLMFGADANLNAPAIVLIVFGCITFLIAAIGCVGACKESSCLLFTFAAIVSILLIAEIVAGAVAVAYQDDIEKFFDDNAYLLMANYTEGSDTAVVDAWDILQENLNCCGITGAGDWRNDTASPHQDGPPKSCGATEEIANTKEDCKTALIDLVKDNILIIGGVGIGFGLCELLGVVFACCVACNIRKGQMA